MKDFDPVDERRLADTAKLLTYESAILVRVRIKLPGPEQLERHLKAIGASPEQRKSIEAVRDVLRKRLDEFNELKVQYATDPAPFQRLWDAEMDAAGRDAVRAVRK